MHNAPLRDLVLDIPPRTTGSGAPQWAGNVSDNPIDDWGADILGRTAVVEQLADYALCQRIPVLALQGGLGDGKSSVLNLLKLSITRSAIIVSFNAWLPGSETSFATELFEDIARECRKYVYVPQLRKRGLAFVRVIGGSVSHLSVLKAVIPAQSQREEINELSDTVSRIPLRIVVLLDEIDRMQKDEIPVLLKILRGAGSIPNITFICAFSKKDVEDEIGKGGDYLEKFFPVSIRLSPPAPEMIARCLLPLLRKRLAEQKWFATEQEADGFEKLLNDTWADAFQPSCTNLRKAGLLLNAALAAGRTIAGEVNPFDLVAIEAIRLFHPEIYQLVRAGGKYLTNADSQSKDPFTAVISAVDRTSDPAAARYLLSLLFPAYARVCGDQLSSIKAGNMRKEEGERICNSEYFQIYFRAAVPEEMFSNSELRQIVSKLNESRTETDAQATFDAVLDSIPAGHPKREDFLFKLSRSVGQLSDGSAEYVAYAASSRAADYRRDVWTLGEVGRALRMILRVAEKLSKTPQAQRVLEGAMARASDDILAGKLLDSLNEPSANHIITDFSKINAPAVKRTFIERMRLRYVPGSNFNWVPSDWRALRCWVKNSPGDQDLEQAYWRAFIGQSRKKLAQAINVIYPQGVWDDDPTPLVNDLFPIGEIKNMLQNLPDGEPLNETEKKAVARIQQMFEGKFPTRSNPTGL